MDIAIITFINKRTNNYGQILQAYALQTYLQRRGHNVRHILYSPIRSIDGRTTNKDKFKPSINSIRAIILKYLIQPYRIYRNKCFNKKSPKDFSEFIDNYLNIIPKHYHSLKELQLNYPQSDAYVCGSDQIWNTGTDSYAEAYYLNFGPKNSLRIAYAPSFGKETTDEGFLKFLKVQLSRFNIISTRELSGVKICKEAGFNAISVIDPTLLLNADTYRLLYDKRYSWAATGKLMCYFLNFRKKTDIEWDKIKKMIRQYSLDLRLTIASGAYPAMDILNYNDYFSPTPDEWIYTVDTADYFITNSFHGVAFAIIFHKQFLYLPLKGSVAKMNDRIFALLKLLKLEDRIFKYNNNIYTSLQKSINWEITDKILQQQQQITDKFFKAVNI